MDPVLGIGFWAVAFVGSHLVLSSAQVRSRLVAMVGEQPYRGIYSLVAFVTIVPLIIVFARHKHAGPMLWYLRNFEAIRVLSWLLMFVAVVLLVASFVSPNPGMIGAPSRRDGAVGVLKLTRHPSFVAISIFGFAHLLMNGWLGDCDLLCHVPRARNSGRAASRSPQAPRIGRIVSRADGTDLILSRCGTWKRPPELDEHRHPMGRNWHRHRPYDSDYHDPSDGFRRLTARLNGLPC